MKLSIVSMGLFIAITSVIGVAFVVNTPAIAADSIEKVPVYRFYQKRTSSHFYTTSESEKERVINTMSSTYRYEGFKFAGWATEGQSRVAVARFYNLKTKTHFYTASASETTRLKLSSQFRYEKVAYYGQNNFVDNDGGGADYDGQCFLYRFYNFQNKTHFYTASEPEAARIYDTMSDKYRYEDAAYIIWADRVCEY